MAPFVLTEDHGCCVICVSKAHIIQSVLCWESCTPRGEVSATPLQIFPVVLVTVCVPVSVAEMREFVWKIELQTGFFNAFALRNEHRK